MNEVTIGISTQEQLSARFLKVWETGQKQGAQINFESEEQLWKTLTLERWQILKTMAGAGEMTITEVAQRVNRDEKIVQNDIKDLCISGLLDTTDKGVIFPYSAIHVDFMLKAA